MNAFYLVIYNSLNMIYDDNLTSNYITYAKLAPMTAACQLPFKFGEPIIKYLLAKGIIYDTSVLPWSDSDNNEDFAVLVKRNTGVAGTANLNFNVYPKGDETLTATSTNPYSGTTFTHTGIRGTKITATGGSTHRFETDGQIIGKQNLTISGMTSLQGGVVIDEKRSENR